MEEEPKEKYYATVAPNGEGWRVRLYAEGLLIRSQSSTYRWHARWLARRGLKRMRIETEIIR